jgi:hypothetical protein
MILPDGPLQHLAYEGRVRGEAASYQDDNAAQVADPRCGAVRRSSVTRARQILRSFPLR